MSRIKILDIPEDAAISREEMKRIKGGIVLSSSLAKSSSQILLTVDPFYIGADSESYHK